WIGAVVVMLTAGVLYFLTAARDIVVGDTPELIMAAVTLGVAHPPGYPLFTMLGHVFSLLPLGPIPFRVNLLSVVSNALAVGVIYLAAVRLTNEDYHPPNPDSVRFDTFKNDIILMYAWPVFRIGNDCLSGGLRDEARKWYERARDQSELFQSARRAGST